MITDNKFRDEKLQYDINRGATKMSALSSGKIDKHESVIAEDMLPSNWSQIIEQDKITYSFLWKAFKKQTEKQGDALNFLNLSNETDELKQTESIFSKKQLHNLIIDQLKKSSNC